MRVSLVYSGTAQTRISLDRLCRLLDRHGHEVISVVGRRAADQALLAPVDLVIAAGGDGTVSAAARAVAGSHVPLAILPAGTANNVARSVGCRGSIEESIAGWRQAPPRPLDIGFVAGATVQRHFVEAVGGGLVPVGIVAAEARPNGDHMGRAQRLAHAASCYLEELLRLRPRRWTLSADGSVTTGEFLLVEVLNIPSVGPNLVLSPSANASDGFLSVVMAYEEHREELADCLRRGGRERTVALPSQRAKQVELVGSGEIHVDEKVMSLPRAERVSIGFSPAAVEILV